MDSESTSELNSSGPGPSVQRELVLSSGAHRRAVGPIKAASQVPPDLPTDKLAPKPRRSEPVTDPQPEPGLLPALPTGKPHRSVMDPKPKPGSLLVPAARRWKITPLSVFSTAIC